MEIVFIVVEEGKILFCFVKFSLDLRKKKINKMQEYIKVLYKIE